MAQLRISNRNIELTVNPALSILQQLQQAGVLIPTGCGGHAHCGMCRVTFLDGIAKANTPNRNETLFREQHGLPENVRLACQTYLLGEALIFIGEKDPGYIT